MTDIQRGLMVLAMNPVRMRRVVNNSCHLLSTYEVLELFAGKFINTLSDTTTVSKGCYDTILIINEDSGKATSP